MLKRFRARPLGWIAAVSTTTLAAATLAAALPGGAAAAGEATYTSSFTQPCVVGPGVLNVKANLKVTTTSKGPASIKDGETVTFSNTVATITTPKELSNTVCIPRRQGSERSHHELRGRRDEPLTGPDKHRQAGSYPSGLPYAVPVVAETETTFTAPTPPANVLVRTARGHRSGNATLTVDTSPGFTEVGAGEYEETGNGIIAETNGYNAEHAKVIGPLTVACNPPAGVVIGSVPITPETSQQDDDHRTTKSTTTATTTTTTSTTTRPKARLKRNSSTGN